MKIVKTASGKNRIKMSKSEWTSIGKKAGWVNELPRDYIEEKERSKRVKELRQQTPLDPDFRDEFESSIDEYNKLCLTCNSVNPLHQIKCGGCGDTFTANNVEFTYTKDPVSPHLL